MVNTEAGTHQTYSSILALPPPELVHLLAPPSSRSDVWSFGVLLWKLFSFSSGQNNVSVSKILRHNWNGELASDLAQFVHKAIRMCLVEVPDLRVTFQELWRVLRSVVSQIEHDVPNVAVVRSEVTPSPFGSVTSTDARRKKSRDKPRLVVSFDCSLNDSAQLAQRALFSPIGRNPGNEHDETLALDEDDTWLERSKVHHLQVADEG